MSTTDAAAVMHTIYERAKAAHAHIILAEGNDPRVTEAADRIRNEGLVAQLTVLTPDSFASLPQAERDAFAGDTKRLAATMVATGEADGFVAGNLCPTADTIRAGLRIIKTTSGLASDFFIMLGAGEPLFFVNCALVPDPTAEQLAAMGIATARFVQDLGIEPRVAFLSFSTAGSANHPMVTKVQEAVRAARTQAPDLAIAESEVQLDAAINKTIAAAKLPGSTVAGSANVLVFPDLNAGNIGYKLAQELAHLQAVGPIFQGFTKPVNDLSRGCTAQDIVDVVAVTAMQAGALRRA